jgi:dipeptidase
MWRFFDLVAPSRQFSPDTPNMEFPFSVKPDKKLSLEDVMTIMRDKYQGTPYDPAEGMKGGPFANPNYHPRALSVDGQSYNMSRPISVNRAEYTTVTQSRSWLPNPIGGIVWIALGAQDTSCFIPFYAGVTKIPKAFSIGDHWVFDRRSARWAFDYVDFHTQVAYSYAIQDVFKAREQWEHGAVERTKAIDTAALALYNQQSDLAVDFLTDYCNINAEKIIDAWWELGDMLLVKYNHLGQYNAEKRRTSMLEYPEWWTREIIKYHNLIPRKNRRD